MKKILILLMLMPGIVLNAQLKRVPVTETTLKIGKKESKDLYFGFDKGDKVLLTVEMKKGKKIRQIEMLEYPDVSMFTEYKSKDIYAKRIKINHRGIYQFRFTNSSICKKILKVKIERIPEDDKNVDFNTTVYWKTETDTVFNMIEKEVEVKHYEVKTVFPLSVYYINSGANAFLAGGKSRVTFPVNLPDNTVEWFYQFSAAKTRDAVGDLNNLTKQLSGIVSDTKTVDISTEDLVQPFGRVYCDIYLMDAENSKRFEKKRAYKYYPEGSRTNIKSGIVKMPGSAGSSFYIGIRNPAKIKGIHVNFEAAAIIQSIEKRIEKVKDPDNFKVSVKKTPYLILGKDS